MHACMQMTAQEGGSNADVLECVRGGGSTLGVVVSMTVRLHDVSDYHGIIFTASEQPDGSSIGCRAPEPCVSFMPEQG